MSAADWLHFLGLVYVLFGLASTINPQALKGAIDELPLNKAAMLNISLISLMLGSAILATHSGWNSVENILVSIIGWGALIKGFTYLAYPNSINHFKPMV